MSDPRSLDSPTIREGHAPSAPAPGTLPPGAELAGRYRILELLGEGGMGVVYRARDLTLEIDVALKVLHPRIAHDPAKVAFFRNEVRVARMVTHPNVCRLHDLEDASDGCFITMEYIAGESLEARLARGRIELGEALRVLRDVASGLAAAHAAGVIHRDLKPSNVLLAQGRAVVVDFGIAGEGRALGAGPQDVAGTRGYMAPEQATGAPLDARADVYALGVLAFALATARRPLPVVSQTVPAGSSAAALAVVDLEPHLGELPPQLADLVAACLAVRPEDRPRDAGAVLRRLDGLRPSRRRTWALVLLLVVVILGAAGLVANRRAELPRAVPAAPRIVLAAVDAAAQPAPERWLATAVQRLVADELAAAWALDVELGAPGDPAPDAVVVATRLSRAPSGRLRLSLAGQSVEASTARELAIAAAGRVIAEHVPAPLRHPTAADLAAVGARDAEAWRLWRRAQHETLLLRWERASQLCLAARARDPDFPLPTLEIALAYDNKDVAATRELADAIGLMARVPVRPIWPLAATGARQLQEGDLAAAARTVEEGRRLDLTPRERIWLELRWAMAIYFNDSPQAAAPALELLAETHPRHPTAFKLLAGMHLGSDQPTAPTLALRYATRAAELAPEDAGVRADLATALLLAGQRDEARARAAELAQLDPEEKRLARGRLFTLHMALGDLAEAELDARRQLSGSPAQRAEGATGIALIDLHWGRFDAGVRGLVATADALDAIGLTVSAARERTLAGRQAHLLGDRATAIAAFERVAGGPTHYAAIARVLAPIAAGNLDAARARAAALPDASVERASVDLAIADAVRDAPGVLAAFARLEKQSNAITQLYAVADALERTGRLDEAAAMFERLANHTRAWNEPIASTRAWYRIGKLRQRFGDTIGAYAAFTEVMQRWGKAATRTPEVDDARRQLRALHAR